MQARLDRTILLAESILKRLESVEKLSTTLPLARRLADTNGDVVEVAWLDLEIYGAEFAPVEPDLQGPPEYEKGLEIFQQLHTTELFQSNMIDHASPNSQHTRYRVPQSISFLEEFAISEHDELRARLYDLRSESQKTKLVWALDCERIVKVVRAAVYNYVANVYKSAVTEKDNQDLLGPDYRIVLNNLDALETGVGCELGATLPNLRETNPGNWSLAAVGCRTVVTKLGNLLWKVPRKTYYSNLNQKRLDVSGANEKNRLYAYIDWHHQHAKEQAHKDTLKHLYSKVWTIYDIGSKGKGGTSVRHEEAKDLVVDTFEFVSQLDAITGLTPLESA